MPGTVQVEAKGACVLCMTTPLSKNELLFLVSRTGYDSCTNTNSPPGPCCLTLSVDPCRGYLTGKNSLFGREKKRKLLITGVICVYQNLITKTKTLLKLWPPSLWTNESAEVNTWNTWCMDTVSELSRDPLNTIGFPISQYHTCKYMCKIRNFNHDQRAKKRIPILCI